LKESEIIIKKNIEEIIKLQGLFGEQSQINRDIFLKKQHISIYSKQASTRGKVNTIVRQQMLLY